MADIRDTEEIRGGAEAKPRKANLFASPRFFLDVHVLRPGQSQAVHRHAGEDKCWYVLSGRGVLVAGGREQALRPGLAAWSAAGEEHGVRCEGEDDLRLLVFMAPRP